MVLLAKAPPLWSEEFGAQDESTTLHLPGAQHTLLHHQIKQTGTKW